MTTTQAPRTRIQRRAVHGVLLLDKPLVVVQLRADVEEVERVEFRVGHVHSSSVIIEECICYPRASASDVSRFGSQKSRPGATP